MGAGLAECWDRWDTSSSTTVRCLWVAGLLPAMTFVLAVHDISLEAVPDIYI